MDDNVRGDEEVKYKPKCGAYHESKYDCQSTIMKKQRELATAMKPAGEILRIVGIDKALEPSVYEKEIWNRAIEAALN